MTNYEALNLARDRGFDLVEINPNGKPPVCKILDYGKFKYELRKSQKTQKTQAGKLKEIRLTSNIGEHDFNTKIERAKEFLEKGNKVRVTVKLMGREMAFQEKAYEQIARAKDALFGKYELAPNRMGNVFSAIVIPDKEKLQPKENTKKTVEPVSKPEVKIQAESIEKKEE